MTEASQAGGARRAVARLAARLGFTETEAGKAALVATEAANNLVTHATDGVLLLGELDVGGSAGIEVLALDRGPGMADVARCLRDGYSTAGTPGGGLGAISRLAAFVDVYSHQPTGTALVARLWHGRPPLPDKSSDRLRVAAVCAPKPGEEVCGDAWAAVRRGGRAVVLVADGLGHGPDAADASRAAVRVVEGNAQLGPVPLLQAVHAALRGTRGAAVAVAEVSLDDRVVRYAGVGNIAATVLAGGATRSLVSHNGTLGHQAHRFQEFTYPFPAGATLVMHSDGLQSRWSLGAYPGLAVRDGALVAGVLYRDFQRGRDDVTVLVAREEDPA